MNVEIGKSFFYRIQKGDDFNTLFEKFNVTKENILRNNDLINLYPGEWVKIKRFVRRVLNALYSRTIGYFHSFPLQISYCLT